MGRVMSNEQLKANGGFVNRVNLDHSEKLADCLTRNKFSAAEIPTLDATTWQVSASLCEIPYPSDEVQRLVRHRMEERERLDRTNPIEGLPQ